MLSLLAGGGDLITGLLLVFAPRWTLERMGVPPAPEPVFLRFVGVFVGCVGASYGYGLLAWRASGSNHRLQCVWEITCLFRTAAGSFVAAEIVAGTLPWPWLSVPAVDGIWTLAQVIGLRLKLFREVSQ